MASEIRWSAPEFHYHEKSSRWYWYVGGGAALIVVIAIFQNNFLFAVFAAIAGFLVGIWGTRTPRTITFTLTDRELDIGGHKVYPLQNIAGFALVEGREDSPFAEIVFHEKGKLGSWVTVMVPKESAEETREAFARSVPEIEYEGSIADRIARLLKF